MDGNGNINSEKNSEELEKGLREILIKHRHGKQVGFTAYCSSQTALVGAQLSPLESLDYEIIENDLFKQNWRSRTKVEIFQYILLKWGLAFLIGLCVGLIAAFVNLAAENTAGFKLLVASRLILQNRYILAFSMFTGANLALTLLAAALTAYIAPTAAGAGVPEIKAYLNGVDSGIKIEYVGALQRVSSTSEKQ